MWPQTVAAAAAVAALTLAGTARAATWKADRYIQPGAPGCFKVSDLHELNPTVLQDHVCATLGFVLRDGRGNYYITTAAHGPEVGERAYTDPADSGGPFPCCGPGGGFGTTVISDDSIDQGNPKIPDPYGSDVALILIDAKKERFVNPAVRHWTGPTGVLDPDEGMPGDPVNTYDVIAEDDMGNRTWGPRTGHLIARSSTNFLSDTVLEEHVGSSGAPFTLADNGEALGLNGNCLCGTAEFGYPTLDYVLRRFRAVEGYEDLELVPAHGAHSPRRGTAARRSPNGTVLAPV